MLQGGQEGDLYREAEEAAVTGHLDKGGGDEKTEVDGFRICFGGSTARTSQCPGYGSEGKKRGFDPSDRVARVPFPEMEEAWIWMRGISGEGETPPPLRKTNKMVPWV